MITSKGSSSSGCPLFCATENLFINHWKASSKYVSTLGSSKQLLLEFSMMLQSLQNGKNFLESTTICSSISIITTFSTVLCFNTSLRVAPSPPPTMATLFGHVCANIAGCTSDSVTTGNDADVRSVAEAIKRKNIWFQITMICCITRTP
jgi:hypothetical protein